MTDDREPFREARAAGLKARQERRLENATYTAAEVKVLTEKATKVAYALGAKDAAEALAERLREFLGTPAGPVAAGIARQYVREIGVGNTLLTAGAVPEPRTQPSEYSDLPQDSQAGSGKGDPNG